MEIFPVISLALAVAALLSYLNHRFVRLPTTVGVMLIALLMSLGVVAASALGVPLRGPAEQLLQRLRFREFLMDGMLAFLLFAGALHVDMKELLNEKLTVGLLATAGVIVSTLIVGGLSWGVSRILGLGLRVEDCVLFGALISPTDPIAVIGILRSNKAPKKLEAQMAGESLFNDGIGVVVFTVVLTLTNASRRVDAQMVGALLSLQVVGSVVLGLAAGWLAYRMLRTVDNYQVEVLITLALASGVYTAAASLGMSGPLAVVVAGLFIAHIGTKAMSERTRQHLDPFWELIDEIMNVVLFLLIGLEVLVVPFSTSVFLAGLAAVVLVLLARFLSVGATVKALARYRAFPPHSIKILTWGGLKGGLSLAMALSLGPDVAGRHLIVAMTYCVVVFSIAVQGLTFGRLLRASL